MNTVSSGVASPGASPIDASSSTGGLMAMSPDALLSYCQNQLGSLDGEMQTEMNAQELALSQRTAVEGVETTLESYGDNGPQTVQDLAKCSQAFDTAIATLGPGDPVAQELAAQQAQMNQDYGNGPTSADQSLYPANYLNANATPLTHPPQNDAWKGTVGALDNLADGIKSDAEIQMLKLQDLVSQRQQVVEQATGMMTKEDQTLDDGAKAIGE